MFYGNTQKAKELLQHWREITLKYPLKADDRLLAKTFNLNKMLTELNYIPLPMEYLWLSDDYDGIDKELSNRRNIFIEHPACLTGEDRAAAEGSASNRVPARYNYEISDQVVCRGRGMPFWEYVFFPKKSLVASLGVWLNFMDSRNLLHLTEYSEKYGDFNDTAEKNKLLAKKIKVDLSQDTLILEPHKGMFPEILANLKKGVDVIVSRKSLSLTKITMNASEYDFVCKNTNSEVKRYKSDYTLKIDKDKPVYFNSNSEVLRHLVTMSNSLSELEKIFNSSFIFISRIRCKWIR